MSEVIDAGMPAGPVTSTEPEVTTDVTAVKPETEAPATPDKPEDQTAEPKESGYLKKINKLTWQRAEARRQLVAARAEAEALRAKLIPKPEVTGKPESSKFNSYEEYLEALADWKVEQRQSERDQKSHKETSERERTERMRKLAMSFEERAEKIREKYQDFDEVTNPILHDDDVQTSQGMAEAIFESDVGPELLYFLGNNPKEFERIAKLGDLAAAREIGKLEAKLPDVVKPVTAAPAPIAPVKPKSQASEAPSESDDMGSWIKKRRKQVHGR
ncbi:MAG TPA: hypothetical protein VJ180_04750 [Pyrinomonadaceae bacterium]|nr:hypothetical protein [Pyrinomonadaceae bacterium]